MVVYFILSREQQPLREGRVGSLREPQRPFWRPGCQAPVPSSQPRLPRLAGSWLQAHIPARPGPPSWPQRHSSNPAFEKRPPCRLVGLKRYLGSHRDRLATKVPCHVFFDSCPFLGDLPTGQAPAVVPWSAGVRPTIITTCSSCLLAVGRTSNMVITVAS